LEICDRLHRLDVVGAEVMGQVIYAAAIEEAILLTVGESFRRPALDLRVAADPLPLDSPLPLEHPSLDRFVIVRIDDGEVEVGILVELGPDLRLVGGDTETDLTTPPEYQALGVDVDALRYGREEIAVIGIGREGTRRGVQEQIVDRPARVAGHEGEELTRRPIHTPFSVEPHSFSAG
jgi:hypothetical protein